MSEGDNAAYVAHDDDPPGRFSWVDPYQLRIVGERSLNPAFVVDRLDNSCEILTGTLADLPKLAALLASRDERGLVKSCACGSGAHPRRCTVHPEAFDRHVREIEEAARAEELHEAAVRAAVDAEREACMEAATRACLARAKDHARVEKNFHALGPDERNQARAEAAEAVKCADDAREAIRSRGRTS